MPENEKTIEVPLSSVLNVKVASIRPGDVVVLEGPDTLSHGQQEGIKAQMAEVFPNNKCVILSGLTLALAREVPA